MISAALGGLLCLASSACSNSDSASSGAETANGDTPIPSTACDGGVDHDPHVTSSTVVADLTLDAFTSQCDAKNGVVEIHPHCGGFNACRGMSYDSATEMLTEHTCRGTNTCAGFSCVVCD